MDIPLKPWEVGYNCSSHSNTVPYISNTERLHSTAVPYPGSGGGGGSIAPSTTVSPPLPPRPGQSQYRPGYSGGGISGYGYANRPMMSYGGSPMYNSGYSSSYYNPYSYASPMGGMYRSVPGRMSAYGPSDTSSPEEPSFTQLAEESSASAFQSIESFVNAFGSISAMLESTFNAVYSSFRAVVGVADHLGRLKQVLSTLAIFRFLRWVIRRILYLIGISKIKPEQIESIWNSLSSEQSRINTPEWEKELKPGSKPSSWPILMFLAFIFAGPYLMWKLIRSLNLNNPEATETKWATGESEHFIAVAEYDFDASMNDRELRLTKGQNIRLAPASNQPHHVRGWVLASDGKKIGLVPSNYIKILGKRPPSISKQVRTNHLVSNYTSLPKPTLSSSTPTTLPLPKVSVEQPQPVLTSVSNSNDYLHLRPAIVTSELEQEKML